MTFIDASTRSALGVVDEDEDDREAEIDEDQSENPLEDREEEAEETPERRRSVKAQLKAWAADINIARDLDSQTLDEIGMAVCREFELDEESRSEWADDARKAIKLATQKAPPKEYPWPGAANNIYPLIAQAALEFGSRTYPAIIQNRNVVKGVVWGDDEGTPATMNGKPDGPPKMAIPPNAPPGTPPEQVWIVAPNERRERADRVAEHMSYQLLNEMKEWEVQTDQLLHQIPVIGGAARKTFYEPAESRNYSLAVSLMDLVWDYNAASFEAAPRHSERVRLYPHEIIENENTAYDEESGEGMWLHLDYGPADGGEKRSDVLDDQESQDASDPDAPHLFIEQHRRWDLDGDGYPEPYTMTVHYRSNKVVRIVARYDMDGVNISRGAVQRIEPIEHYTLYRFFPNIEGGSYPMGFGHLLHGLNEGINSTLNQMFDAGHLANTGSGFISDSLTAPSGDYSFRVGKFIRVTTKGQAIKDAVYPIPFQGPNPVLFQLLGFLVQAAEKLASVQNVLTGDAAIANAPPTTILALIEQGMKVHNAIQKRVFLALKCEADKLHDLNKKHLKEETKFRTGDKWSSVTPDDYRLSGGVEPVADPSMTTDMQKLGRAQVVLSTVGGDPAWDQRAIKVRVLEAAGIDRITDLFAPPDPNQGVMAQMAMAKMQADLGETRSAEQKNLAQAYLAMAQARKAASGVELDQIEANLRAWEMRIESLNAAARASEAQTHAAAVDHKFHQTAADERMHAAGLEADRVANGGTPAPPLTLPTPAPSTPPPTISAQPPAGAPGPMPTVPGGPALPPKTASNADLPPLPPPGSSPLAGAPGAPQPHAQSALGAGGGPPQGM